MPKSSFHAVCHPDTRLLILGSLPGEVSLARAQYYAHPQNQFWRLMQAVIERPLVELAYPERLETLLEAGVGLWDVVRSAERVGSLDTAIRNLEANPLADFVATLPALRAVGYNGGKASAVGRARLAQDGGPAQVTLPSSSPAHAVPFERKAAEWLRLRAFLNPAS